MESGYNVLLSSLLLAANILPTAAAMVAARTVSVVNAADNDARTTEIHKRLLAHVPHTERVRFARTLAALEAHHRNILHSAVMAGEEAAQQLAISKTEAALASHAAAASDAKHRCTIEELRSAVVQLELQISLESHRAAEAEQGREAALGRAQISERVLAAELRAAEVGYVEVSGLLREVYRTAAVKGEHLSAVQQQSSRSTELLVQLHEQSLLLQKRLSQQVRRTAKLQDLQHTSDTAARSGQLERSKLAAAAAVAEEAASSARVRAEWLEAQLEAAGIEASQEREASERALAGGLAAHQAEVGSLRLQVASLAALVSCLLSDKTKVQLRSGGGSTVGAYVQALQRRLERRGAAASPKPLSHPKAADA